MSIAQERKLVCRWKLDKVILFCTSGPFSPRLAKLPTNLSVWVQNSAPLRQSARGDCAAAGAGRLNGDVCVFPPWQFGPAKLF